jgi:23S rRNA (uracil1939-C5)-methyltransferase
MEQVGTAPGSLLTLRVERMGRNGEGVATLPDGRVVFVAGALPGETVTARLTEMRSRFARATTVAVEMPAPDRVAPPCPVYDACGGCVFQHWDYDAELRYKTQRVRDALERIAGVPNPPVEPVRGSLDPYLYRAKGSFPWGGQPGRLTLGLYRRGTHDLVPVTACLIQDPLVNEVIRAAVPAADALGLEPYDEAYHAGLLRHLVVRMSRAEQRAVALLVSRADDPRFRRWALALMEAVPAVKGVAVNVNPDRGNRILGPTTRALAGDPWLTEEILGARFRVAPDAFFQVHPGQVAVLYRIVLDTVVPAATVWDLYAGVGTLAVLLAREGCAVRAVEVVPSAVEAGRANAASNGVAVRFHAGAAEEVVPRLVERGERPDVVVADPPRSGLRPPVIEALLAAAPSRIVYVSCEPESLARDVGALMVQYELVRAAPVDLFPRTDHVETVAVLERRA